MIVTPIVNDYDLVIIILLFQISINFDNCMLNASSFVVGWNND